MCQLISLSSEQYDYSTAPCFTSSLSGGALHPQIFIPNPFFISVHYISNVFLVFSCFGGNKLFEIKISFNLCDALCFFSVLSVIRCSLGVLVCVLCLRFAAENIRRGGLWW